MLYFTGPDDKGHRHLANFTGVLMVQRDLFFPGEYEDQPTNLTDMGRLPDIDSE